MQITVTWYFYNLNGNFYDDNLFLREANFNSSPRFWHVYGFVGET